jgi:hypothetical protein
VPVAFRLDPLFRSARNLPMALPHAAPGLRISPLMRACGLAARWKLCAPRRYLAAGLGFLPSPNPPSAGGLPVRGRSDIDIERERDGAGVGAISESCQSGCGAGPGSAATAPWRQIRQSAPSQNEKAPDLRALAGMSSSVQRGSGLAGEHPCITR